MRRFLAVVVFCPALPLWAQTLETLDFSGPVSAPIYVLDGQFQYQTNVNGVSMNLDWAGSMDPATGIFSGKGNFSANGSLLSIIPIDWDGNVSTTMNLKAAGNVLRVEGKMSVTGSGTVGNDTVDNLVLDYTLANLDVNAAASRMRGYVSFRGFAKVRGRTLPLAFPKTYLSLGLPDENHDGKWDSGGDWTEAVTISIDAKGKVSGNGEFEVLDEQGGSFDLIYQKITGTLKKGTVTLTASGSQSSTAKVKISLTYPQPSDPSARTVATMNGKSSVSAYGQSRKF